MWDSFGILFWLTVQIQFDVLYKWNALAGDAFLLQMTSFASWMPTFLSCSSEGPVEALLAFTSLKKLHRWASNAFLMRGLASEKLKSRRQHQNNQKKPNWFGVERGKSDSVLTSVQQKIFGMLCTCPIAAPVAFLAAASSLFWRKMGPDPRSDLQQ